MCVDNDSKKMKEFKSLASQKYGNTVWLKWDFKNNSSMIILLSNWTYQTSSNEKNENNDNE